MRKDRKELLPDGCPLKHNAVSRRIIGAKCIEGCIGPTKFTVTFPEISTDAPGLLAYMRDVELCGSKSPYDQLLEYEGVYAESTSDDYKKQLAIFVIPSDVNRHAYPRTIPVITTRRVRK